MVPVLFGLLAATVLIAWYGADKVLVAVLSVGFLGVSMPCGGQMLLIIVDDNV